MISSTVDSFLARYAAKRRKGVFSEVLPTRIIETSVGPVRVYDSKSDRPCVVFAPDGPNVIEHYERLIELLSSKLRVVCFDMPGFGFSLPRSSYEHSLDQGAQAVLGVLDALAIKNATLAFSCANGFYALRVAQIAPDRISSLVLSQTPSMSAMHTWGKRAIPLPLRVPVLGQAVGWLIRKKSAHIWYGIALPKTTSAKPFEEKAQHALDGGGCFCLASVCQGLVRETVDSLLGVTTPCTLLWGTKDHSHKYTDPRSLHELVPSAEIILIEDCGHFPDVEQPERFASILMERLARYA